MRGPAGDVLLAVSGVVVVGVFAYAIRVTAGTGRRPTGPEAKRIERSVTVATIIELVASFADIGDGNGGYWEDNGYEWYAGI